jgi:mxaJ protein
MTTLGLALLVLATSARPALRVCADPNNLPFSNARLEGFENKLATLLGRELGLPVRYTWWAQRRGFIRNTLGAHSCDVIMGVPAALEMVRTTRPYYRSSYVFVSRADRNVAVRSFDDPALSRLRIGVPLVGDDGANPPPAHALGRRGIVDNVVGFSVYGDYRQDSPPLRVLDAVVGGDVDVAVVWGPLAGYFARKNRVPLRIHATLPSDGGLPFAFDMAVGVRKDDLALASTLDAALARRHTEVVRILDDYGVPQVSAQEVRR